MEGKQLNLRPAKMKQILGCIAVAVGFFFLIQLGKMFLQKITIILKNVKLFFPAKIVGNKVDLFVNVHVSAIFNILGRGITLSLFY